MDIRQLKYVLVLAKHCSFTKAAKELSITQPALSAQISLIEEELEVKLFTRTTRAVKPTAAGLIFCDKAQQLMDVWEDMMQVLASQREKDLTPVKIGLPLRAAHCSPAFEVCMSFFDQHPDYEISYISDSDDKLLSMTYAGELDATLCSLPLEGEILRCASKLSQIPLMEEPPCAMMTKGHFLSQRQSMELSDLQGCTLITGPEKSSGAQLLEKLTKELGLESFEIIRSNGIEMTARLVKGDEGIAFGTKSVADYYGLASVPITDFPQKQLGLVYRSDNTNPILPELWNYLQIHLK